MKSATALWLAAALLVVPGCGGSDPPPGCTDESGDCGVSSGSVVSQDGGSDAADDVTHDCDTQHVWDAAAGACRLYPGGGNGWAGCSSSTAPPNGEACVTGTHWVGPSCDCVCDDPDQDWDDAQHACVDRMR